MSEETNNNRIVRNTAYLYLRMVLVLIVGLYTSRVVLNALGASDFGVYNVVAGFVSLFAFLNATLSASLQRFYNFEGGKRGDSGYTDVFSVGMRVHLVLSLVVLVILESFGLWYVNHVMVLPEGRLPAANLLFQFSVLSMILIILQIPYSGAIIAKEKIDFYAVVCIVEVFLRLFLIILLPYSPFDKLIVYAYIQLFITIFDFLLFYFYSKKNFKYLCLTKKVNKDMLRGILSFSGWTLIGAFAFLLKGQGLNLLLNSFFNTIVNAAYGVAYQVSGAISGFSNNISMAFRPQMVDCYAKEDYKRSYTLFLTQSKICFCLILMLITPVILEMDYLLHLWLGEATPEYTNVFTALVLVDSLLATLNAPVTQMVFATGNIKKFQIYSTVVNLLLLPICWVFLKSGYDAWMVFVIAIIISVFLQVVCLYIMHFVFDYSYSDYIKQIVWPCFTMIILVPLLPYVLTQCMDDSWIRLSCVSFVSLVVTVTLLYFLFLTESEKFLAKSILLKIVKK